MLTPGSGRRVGTDLAEETGNLLIDRMRTGLVLMLAATVVFILADLILRRGSVPAVHLIQLVQIGIASGVLAALDLPRMQRRAVTMGLLGVGTFGVTIAANGILRSDAITPALLCGILAMGAATLIPWGLRAQLMAVTIMGAALLWNVGEVEGSLAAVRGYPTLGVLVAFGASAYIAHDLGRFHCFASRSERQRMRAETLLRRQKNVLEMIVKGTPLASILEMIARSVEEPSEGMLCSILLLDEENQVLRHGAAPSLPESYNRAVDGMTIGPLAGSCGTAAHLGDTVVVTDIARDPRWRSFRDLALNSRLRACWSTPIRAMDGRVLGTFAMYYHEGRGPTLEESELVEIASHLAGIAIDRKQAEERQREEAEIAAALARVGQVLISSLDRPVLLDRLCQVTAEVLQCDLSHTLLWHPEERAFRPVAQYGSTAEEREMAGLVKVPRDTMEILLKRLDCDDVAQVGTIPDQVLASSHRRRFSVSLQLCIALRRGEEVIGVQVASSRDRSRPFTARQRRIARGIGQLASLALQNARLLEELERASSLKSQFVSTMSHELRTPLNVILGYDALLLDGSFGALAPEQQEPLRRIDHNARQLLELITDTLNLGRLEAGQVRVEMQEFSIPELLREVDLEVRPLFDDKPEVEFTWGVMPGISFINTDRTKLKVVLKNLVGNASKFTERGTVRVEAFHRDGGVEFTVADTGIGIPREALAIIFEAFRQVDGSTTRRHGGVGLGLHIVRGLLKLLGGRIGVESEVGRGSTFRVWCPNAVESELPMENTAVDPAA